jgi:serine/threonine protein kinase
MPDPDPPADPEERTSDDELLDAGLAGYFGATPTEEFEAPGQPGMPDRIGDYQILRRIGSGAMGDVYLAEEIRLSRRVALKILKSDLTASTEAIARFQIEASSVARLKHPGIVQVFAVGESDGRHFIAMELIEGSPLHEVIAQLRAEGLPALDGSRVGRAVTSASHKVSRDSVAERVDQDADGRVFDPTPEWDRSYIETVCRLVARIADALEHAHDAGVIHRDVKPSNILVLEDGSAVLTDFGLARADNLPSVTKRDMYLGTPHYSSPEQARAKKGVIDHRTDVFSLGVTLYELLTLRLPFEGSTSIEVLDKIREVNPPNPRRLNHRVPRDLVTILLTALEKDREARYATAGAFAADLRALLATEPISARRRSLATRVVKFVRRHLAASAAIALVGTAAGAAAVFWDQFPGTAKLPPGDYVLFIDGERRDAGVREVSLDAGPHDFFVEQRATLRAAWLEVRISPVWTTPVSLILESVWQQIERGGADSTLLKKLTSEFKADLRERIHGDENAFRKLLTDAKPDNTNAWIDQLEDLGESTQRVAKFRELSRRARDLREDRPGSKIKRALTLLGSPADSQSWKQLPSRVRSIAKDIVDMESTRSERWRDIITEAGIPPSLGTRFAYRSDRETKLRRDLERMLVELANRQSDSTEKIWSERAPAAWDAWLETTERRLLAILVELRAINPEHADIGKLTDGLFRSLEKCACQRQTAEHVAKVGARMQVAKSALKLVTAPPEIASVERVLAKYRERDENEARYAHVLEVFAAEDMGRFPLKHTLGRMSSKQNEEIELARAFLTDCSTLRSLCYQYEFHKAVGLLARLRRDPLPSRFRASRESLLQELENLHSEQHSCYTFSLLGAADDHILDGNLDAARPLLMEARAMRFDDMNPRIEWLENRLARADRDVAQRITEAALQRFIGGLGAPETNLEAAHGALLDACQKELDLREGKCDADPLRIARLCLWRSKFEEAIRAAKKAKDEQMARPLLLGQAEYCLWKQSRKEVRHLSSAIKYFLEADKRDSKPGNRRVKYWLGICERYRHDESVEHSYQNGLRAALPLLRAAPDYSHAKQQLAVAWIDLDPKGNETERLHLENARSVTNGFDFERVAFHEDEVFGIFGGYRKASIKARNDFLIAIMYSRAQALTGLEESREDLLEAVELCSTILSLNEAFGDASYCRGIARLRLQPQPKSIPTAMKLAIRADMLHAREHGSSRIVEEAEKVLERIK